MNQLNPVSRPSFPMEGRGGLIIGIIVVAVALAVLKPWGPEDGSSDLAQTSVAASPVLSPSPTPGPTPNPLDAISRKYDPLVFGDRELQTDWGLWPAGYLTSLGFAMRAEPSSQPEAVGSSQPSPSPHGPAADVPRWPSVIDINFGNHLLMMGISTPTDHTVNSLHLTRERADGVWEDVDILLLPPPWPNHFTVVGIDGGLGPDRPIFWVPGHYRLDVGIVPGQIQREIEIDVEGPAATPLSTVPAASDLPATSGPARP
jgi:hypothetical protein